MRKTDEITGIFPDRLKIAGWALVVIGIALAFVYLYKDFRITAPVFALASYYLEPKFLASFPTNIADELVLLCLLGGFFIIVFSKGRTGEEKYDHLKGKALFKAFFYNGILLFFSILFFYGQAFLLVLILNVFSVFMLYLVFLRIMKREFLNAGEKG